MRAGPRYHGVIHDPQVAVPYAESEEICYFFAHLYRERFGDFPDTGSGIARESCSNSAGWAPEAGNLIATEHPHTPLSG